MKTVDGQFCPCLRAGVRLRDDPSRGQWVLLAPERVVELDEIALLVVQQFDGQRTVDDIATALAKQFDAPITEIQDDVVELVTQLRSKHLLQS